LCRSRYRWSDHPYDGASVVEVDASELNHRDLHGPKADQTQAQRCSLSSWSLSWSSFLRKLSIPLTSRIRETGDWIEQTLGTAGTTLFDAGPRTLTHNDVQADNLFFGAAEGGVIFIDWQMVTYARCVIDVGGWIRGSLQPEVRRTVESQLIRLYHDALVANGVHDYTFDHCLVDYQLATVLAPARLACAVGLSDGLQAHPGAFWDTLFPRYAH
jgi:aminoglycoside phosphotransferase (APT) family kinase protein